MRLIVAAPVALVLLLLAGCGSMSMGSMGSMGSRDSVSAHPSEKSSTHVMSDGSTMSDAEMAAMEHAPSEAASMVCSEEIRDAVKTLFRLSGTPSSTHSWSDGLYDCTYQLPQGQLHLSVKDLSAEPAGRNYFDALKTRLAPVSKLKGMESFGLPAFETAAGDVVFLKDSRTLRVDASGVPADALPAGYSAAEAAYSLAASVIACWTE